MTEIDEKEFEEYLKLRNQLFKILNEHDACRSSHVLISCLAEFIACQEDPNTCYQLAIGALKALLEDKINANA